MLPKIDKNSYIPAYIQIKDHFLKLIETQKLKPGDQIPPENDIVQSSGLSRMTVRQGIQQLVQQGYLKAQRGLGTFVTIPTFTIDTMSFCSLNKRDMFQNTQINTTIYVLEETKADDKIAEILNIKPGSEVWYFERSRFKEETPLIFETCYFPKAIFPKVSKKYLEKSKYEWVQNATSNVIAFAKRHFTAVVSDQKIVSVFKDIELNVPMIQKNTIGYFENQIPFEYSSVWYHPNNYSLNEIQSFKE
ncbi:MAG: GntR family transcriptional regulator [Brevinemataceae bacterium]